MSLEFYIVIISAIIATLTLIGLVFNYLLMPNVYRHIDMRTEPIQPDANGGKSLPDIALAVGELRSDVKHMSSRLTRLEKKIG